MTFTLSLPLLLLLLALAVGVASAFNAALDYLIDRYTLLWRSGHLPRLVRTWYGPGRTVHHPDHGRCTVLAIDRWADVPSSWLFIGPLDDDIDPGWWVPLSQVTETAEEMRAGEHR